jgi:Tol biopolymer transport system component
MLGAFKRCRIGGQDAQISAHAHRDLRVVAVSLPLASPANATTPGRNGRITFMEPDTAGFWQVWVANADLSGQKQLTHGAANSEWPVWSPDGKKIAFDTDRGDADPDNDPAINDIFTMNTDGSGLRNLTGSKGVQRRCRMVPGQ